MATSTKRQHVDVVNTTDENYDPNPGVIIFLNTNAILDQIIRLPGSPITIPAPGPQAATNAFSEWITNQLGSVSASLQENLIEEIGLFPIPQNALAFQALKSKELDKFQFKMSIPRIWIHNMELQGLTAGGILVCRDSGRGSLSITKLTFGIFR